MLDGASQWHTACAESMLVEDIWPGAMCCCHLCFRGDGPIQPCSYCALFHRAPFSVSSDSEEMVRLRILRAKPAYDGGAASAAARAVLERLLARDWRSRPTAAQALRLAGAWLDGAKSS